MQPFCLVQYKDVPVDEDDEEIQGHIGTLNRTSGNTHRVLYN